MIIGIDGNEANVVRKVGVSEFAFELLKQFSEMNLQDVKFLVYLKNAPNADLPKTSPTWKYRILTPKKLWTQWRLPLDLYTHSPKPDVFFTPSHYAPRFSPVPTVISIMDVSYLHFPLMFNKADLYQLENWTAYSARNAKAILTISNSAKNDIMKAYQIPESNVRVVYPGIKSMSRSQPKENSMDALKEKHDINGKYILFVGTLQPRKNIERLIEAFAKVYQLEKDPSLQLVIVGKKGWLYEPILQAPEKFGVAEQVKFLDFVPDKALPALYQHAVCYVLPSLYEGFGLPILEAMKHDCPVITSNVSSMPEAGGDAALYIDPKNTDDIAGKISLLLHDEKLRKDLIEKGKKQLAKFSWEKAATETLEVLQQVARK